MISRRTFLGRAGLGALAGGALVGSAGGYAVAFNSTNAIEVVEHTLRYPDLAPDLEDFRIGFVSDFHLGGWVQTELILLTIRKLRAAQLDLVMLGGDHIWVPEAPGELDAFVNPRFSGDNEEQIARRIFIELSALLREMCVETPVCAVLGNHDRWSSFDCYREMEKVGVEVLQNRAFEIRRGTHTVRVYGTEDLWTGVPVPPPPPAEREFAILLTHNPDYASYVYHQRSIPFHLALAGHTHGGQIKLPFIGSPFYNVRDLRYREGLVDYGHTKFYTNRGVGVVELPFRVNCPPEVTILKLAKA